MKTWQAILLTLGIIIFFNAFMPPLSINLVILGTTVWAVKDSRKIELHKYKSGIALKPVTLAIGFLGLWIAAFPWYLSARYRILNGLAELKNEHKSAAVISAT